MSDHTIMRVSVTFPDGRILWFSTKVFGLPSLEELESVGPVCLTYRKRNPRTLTRKITLREDRENS